jgi:hypothetical protein
MVAPIEPITTVRIRMTNCKQDNDPSLLGCSMTNALNDQVQRPTHVGGGDARDSSH